VEGEGKPDSAAKGALKEWLALGLAAFAAMLAVAPYVFPPAAETVVAIALKARPETVGDALAAMDARKTAQQSAALEAAVRANRDALFVTGDPVIGRPDARLKVVVFEDYHCGFCRAMVPAMQTLVSTHPDLAFEIKEYPILSPASRDLAALALAAPDGDYGRVHALFYSRPFADEAEAVRALTLDGQDGAALQRAAHAPAVAARLNATLALGRRLGIDATPTFVVGDTVISGARPDALRQAVETALRR